jgi:large subunit ribosomal protein L9
VVIAARAADEGKLFGSIGARDVAEAIVKYTGAAVEPDQVRLAGPIKEIGLHTITVRPHPEVSIEVTLDVIPT